MEIGSKVKILPQFQYDNLPDKFGEVVLIEEDWIVVKTDVAAPHISPLTIKRRWEVELVTGSP
jgi:hypothetical protein